MENIAFKNKKANKDNLTVLKYCFFIYCFLIFFCSLLLLAFGIYIGVDRNFLTLIIGNNLYAAATFMILAGGAIVFVVSYLGCCGIIRESRCLMFILFITLIVVCVLLILAGILAIVFKSQIGSKVQDTMSDTLISYYGINFQNDYNRAVTDAWDIAQERLKCCAVQSKGWYLYRKSEWFKQFGAQTGRDTTFEEDTARPYVPLSCCIKDVFWKYINQNVCQRWRMGPPGSPVDGAINRAVYYDGCFDAGYNYLAANTSILVGLGFGIGIFLIIGIILSGLILIKLPNSRNNKK